MVLKTIFHTQRKLKLFDKLVLILNGLFALALLLSYLAPFADPRSFSLFALFGLGYQLLLPVNVAFLIYWLIRSIPCMLISGICILIGPGVFFKNWGYHLAGQPDKKANAGEIRVMTYNVHDFMGPLNANSTRTAIAQFISEKQPDIIGLQEYTDNILDYKATIAALSNAMHSNHHYFKAYDYTSWDSTGIAIYTRYPIINHGVIASVNTRNIQAIFADVKYDHKIFRIYTTHLQPTHFEAPEHEYLHALQRSGKIDLHEWLQIYRKLNTAFAIRSRQVALIKQHMSACPYPYLIAGDFNDTPASFTVNRMGKGLKNAFIEKGCGFGITYYGDFPHLQIDYIMASMQFSILNYQIIREKISDHYPVISDMRLN